MSTFESLLSQHGTHRRKKKRRRLEKGARGGAAETAAAATGDKADPLPRMTLGRAIASLVSRPGAAPRRPNGAPASEAGVLIVALLIDRPSAFPHAKIWERWLNACAASSLDRTRISARWKRPRTRSLITWTHLRTLIRSWPNRENYRWLLTMTTTMIC